MKKKYLRSRACVTRFLHLILEPAADLRDCATIARPYESAREIRRISRNLSRLLRQSKYDETDVSRVTPTPTRRRVTRSRERVSEFHLVAGSKFHEGEARASWVSTSPPRPSTSFGGAEEDSFSRPPSS